MLGSGRIVPSVVHRHWAPICSIVRTADIDIGYHAPVGHRPCPPCLAGRSRQQLTELEEDGLVRRQVYREVPPRVEYSLTSFGESLRPVLQAMADWGAKTIKRN
jgi:hypothetical protein